MIVIFVLISLRVHCATLFKLLIWIVKDVVKL